MLCVDVDRRRFQIGGFDDEAMESESLAKMRRLEEDDETVNFLVDSFRVDDATLERVVALLSAEMEKGLDAEGHSTADVKMFPTYVTGVADGTEKGDFLAIDFGRSNFRILWVHLPGNDGEGDAATRKTPIVRSRIFVVSPPLMTGPGTALFDFIAKCLASFMEKEGLLGRKLSLCFTFAFPIRQESLDSGRLVKWTKGFSCAGVEGNDVVEIFHDALTRLGATQPGLDGVRCVAIIDDATGTFMACTYAHSDCRIGVIFGTGTNACYLESASKVGTWKAGDSAKDGNAKSVIVNTSWGYFGRNGCLDFLRTEFDKENDRRSSKPGECVFEKLVAGHYLGEVVRLALIKLYSTGVLFRDSTAFGPSLAPPFPYANASPGMSRSSSSASIGSDERCLDADADDDGDLPKFLNPERRRSFHTKYLTEVDGGQGGDDVMVMKQVLAECGVRNPSVRECEIVKKICQAVPARAAHLCAAALVALLKRVSLPRVTVGVDGSLFKFHSRFHDLLKEKVNQLLVSSGTQAELVLAGDGNGKGAALVAAVAERIRADSSAKEHEPMQL